MLASSLPVHLCAVVVASMCFFLCLSVSRCAFVCFCLCVLLCLSLSQAVVCFLRSQHLSPEASFCASGSHSASLYPPTIRVSVAEGVDEERLERRHKLARGTRALQNHIVCKKQKLELVFALDYTHMRTRMLSMMMRTRCSG